MSDDPDLSRRGFLAGLGAIAGTGGIPELPNAGPHLHEEAMRLAMEYMADEFTGLPNNKTETLAVLQTAIEGYRSGRFRHHPLAGAIEVDHEDMAAALEDAATLIRNDWKPPQWWFDFARRRALQFFGSGEIAEPALDVEGGHAPKPSQQAPVIGHDAADGPPQQRAPTMPLHDVVSAVGTKESRPPPRIGHRGPNIDDGRLDLSRRDLLEGVGAAIVASAAPKAAIEIASTATSKEAIEVATQGVGQGLHPVAAQLATNVWHLHEPYYAHYPNDFQDLRAEVIQYVTDVAGDLERTTRTYGRETFKDTVHAYRDAARLLEAGWTPPARSSTVERETERAPPTEEPIQSGMPREATRTITLAEHVDELRAELHGSLDSRERETIAAELDAARAALKRQEHVIGGGPHGEPDTIAGTAVVTRVDEYPDITAHSDPVGVPLQSADGSISMHLGNGEWQDIDRTPGAFTAVRLWPGHNSGTEDYRLYDHTGKQVAHADVAIVGNEAHVANIEAAGGANSLGIRALRILQAKLKEEFPELATVKGLRDDGPGMVRVQEVGFRTAIQNEPLDHLTTKAQRHDFDSTVARLSAETGLPHTPAAGGEFVAGIYRQSLTLSSGRFAMIDNGLGFALVPWAPELDRRLGRHVTGVAQESGGVEWSLGRKRGLEI